MDSVVALAVWNSRQGCIVARGTGFVVHAGLGLIVTCSHLPYMTTGLPRVTRPLYLLVGVGASHASPTFCFLATVVKVGGAKYRGNVCVVRITARLESDVPQSGDSFTIRLPGHPISKMDLSHFRALPLSTAFSRIGDPVQVIGFHDSPSAQNCDNASICCSLERLTGSLTTLGLPSGVSHAGSMVVVAHGGSRITGYAGSPVLDEQGRVVGMLDVEYDGIDHANTNTGMEHGPSMVPIRKFWSVLQQVFQNYNMSLQASKEASL